MLGTKERAFAPLPAVTLDALVPAGHFYRQLEAKLDLAFVRDLVRDRYAARGRPGVDPVVFFKLQLVMFFEGLRSERQLMAVAADRLSVRWYLGYDLDEALPDHTFDDGRASQWEAAHELNARGLVGVFFVQGGGTALSDEQLRQLVAWGHELAAHSMSHPLLTQLSDDELEYEVAGAKAALEATLGVPIAFFAYPFGDYDARVVAAVAAAGYRGALAAWGGAAWTPEQRWEQPRIIVSGYATLADFAALVTSATP